MNRDDNGGRLFDATSVVKVWGTMVVCYEGYPTEDIRFGQRNCGLGRGDGHGGSGTCVGWVVGTRRGTRGRGKRYGTQARTTGKMGYHTGFGQ